MPKAKPGDDQDADERLQWHRVQGVRVKKGAAPLGSPDMSESVERLALILEPVRHLTYWHLARMVKAPSRVPPLLDLVTDEFSPVVAALQYLSAYLAGKSRRWTLILASAKCNDIAEFVALHPENARKHRRLGILVSTWIRERHQRPADELFFVGVADKRLREERRNILDQTFFCDTAMLLTGGIAETTARYDYSSRAVELHIVETGPLHILRLERTLNWRPRMQTRKEQTQRYCRLVLDIVSRRVHTGRNAECEQGRPRGMSQG